ncbi:hypothetical protein QJS10_CPB18g01130 [Acorus calamus]|uniref:Uncharacterized protein n=1 Tax=Acorus calamus TaxID=4465 RepID=A0AAV9CNK4_ACOCL|nr:hypothetical protein QJS10_CPB18g01130 [Acorus calamus]
MLLGGLAFLVGSNFFYQGLKDWHPISMSAPLNVKVIVTVVTVIFLAIVALLCYLSCRYSRLVQRPLLDLEMGDSNGDREGGSDGEVSGGSDGGNDSGGGDDSNGNEDGDIQNRPTAGELH